MSRVCVYQELVTVTFLSMKITLFSDTIAKKWLLIQFSHFVKIFHMALFVRVSIIDNKNSIWWYFAKETAPTLMLKSKISGTPVIGGGERAQTS